MIKGIFKNKFLKVVTVLLIIAAIGIGGYKYVNKTDEASSEITTTKEEIVTRGDISIDFDGDGEAEIPVINLDFDITGKLEEIYVSEGDYIEKDQLLAKLDDTEYANKLKTEEINYKKALANLEQTRENRKLDLMNEEQSLKNAKMSLEQAESEYFAMLKVSDAYTKQEIDQKRISYESAKLEYESQLERYNTTKNSTIDLDLQEANVESAKLSLELAQEDYNDTILKSPMEGKIIYISYKVGETVQDASNSDSATADTSHFMVVSDSDKVEVVVPVSEIDLAKVELGQSVEVEFEAFENKVFEGKVESINALPLIDSSGIVTYDVRIELLGDDLDEIKSGMTCTLAFILRQSKDVLIVPNKAVKIVDGKQTVKVKKENGEAEIRTIKTGLTDGKNVEVTEGLNEGEIVLIEEKTKAGE